MFLAFGFRPSPGIVIIAPASGYTNPAPTDTRASCTGNTNPSGRPFSFGSCDSEVLRLRHADRHASVAQLLEPLEALLRQRRELDAFGSVDPRRERLDLLAERCLLRIQEPERRRLVRRFDERLRQLLAPGPTVGEQGADVRSVRAGGSRDLPDQLELCFRIGGEPVDRHHHRHAVQSDVLDLLDEVARTGAHRVQVLLAERLRQRLASDDVEPPRMHLQRPHRRDQQRRVRPESRDATLDVEELLRTHVGAEARLGDDEIGAAQRDLVGDDRGVAVRDVRERAGVHERRRALEGLHQGRLDRLAQEDGHRAGGLQVLRGDRVSAPVVPDDHPAEALTQVVRIGRETEHGHHLARRGDVEPRRPRHAVLRSAEPDLDLAQRTIVDVDDAAPGDRLRIEVVRVVEQQRRVDHRGEQVVRRRHRVEVARQVQVEVLRRHDLAPATARRAALDAEHRPHRRLANDAARAFADPVQRHRDPDGVHGLALAERRRRDRGHDHVLAARPELLAPHHVEAHLGHGATVELQIVLAEAEQPRDVGQRTEGNGTGDLEVVQSSRRSLGGIGATAEPR